jgi:hypothetical protein
MLRLRPLPASLALVSMAVGAIVIISLAAVAFIPLLLGAAVVTAWLVALLLLGWAGIEALAALERWVETDPRFKR